MSLEHVVNPISLKSIIGGPFLLFLELVKSHWEPKLENKVKDKAG